MRKTILFLLLWGGGIFLSTLAAQDQTLFSGNTKLGFFVGPTLQLGPVAGEWAGFAGVKAALTFNRNFAVGGMYSASFNEFTPASAPFPNTYLDMRLGGLLLEYTWQPSRLLHLSFPLVLGAGEAELDWREENRPRFDRSLGEENFFFFEPGAMLEVNLLPFMRLQAGATYRIIPGEVSYYDFDAGDFSGVTATLGLKFGLSR